MKDSEFRALGQDILDAIEFLKARGWSVSSVCELLKDIEKLPRRWKSIDNRFQNSENTNINIDLFNDIKTKLKDAIVSSLLYDNKMVQILKPIDDTFDRLLKHFDSNIKSDVSEIELSDLVSTEDGLSVKFKIDDRYQAYGLKTIIEDKIKEHLEEEVNQDIQREYSVIYGIKDIKIPAMMLVVFDTVDKTIIACMDLARIVHINKVDAKLSEFKVSIKSSLKGVRFNSTPVNLFPKIKEFHDNFSTGTAFNMSFKTINDGMIHHIHSNNQHPDARSNKYHKDGAKGVNHTLAYFRIHMGYKTSKKTTYAIDLKSIASMTTQKDPVLYSAIINALNAEDFSEALSRLK
ncbi:hypothetical protein [Psychrobacter sp. UBA3962]|uniref:hypothetical protein n=1 Tax=Psychrobacter sp. UBA3962 TaxID=1947352 RepID=UPI0025DF1A7A|nr:hypothetical protein [Psychrobacter sp. UBA3962]